mmetsp:Transcript_25797/g.37474  ORF Transcript_25797/g.37474 Transcript_25797/m.37474 type:complete len:383 (+) Transcript_25797:158-1306(+)
MPLITQNTMKRMTFLSCSTVLLFVLTSTAVFETIAFCPVPTINALTNFDTEKLKRLCGSDRVYAGDKHVSFRRKMAYRLLSFESTSSVVGDGYIMTNDDEKTQRDLRFSGVGRLYADESMEASNKVSESQSPHLDIIDRLTKSTVAVVGLGGVGSWAAEALCRSGIGNIILIDLDEICISNTNRQLHALESTVGKSKIDEMKSRLLDINPCCNITTIHDFITRDNVDEIVESLLPEITICLDAIDGQLEKTALIAACADRGIPIVTCGGAAGRMDPTKITYDDLSKAQECRLLFRCRKNLRQEYGFKRGPPAGHRKPKKFNITAVFSTEVQKSVVQQDTSSLRRCDGALGTSCFVTGTYGFVAASRIVEMIAKDEVLIPKPY